MGLYTSFNKLNELLRNDEELVRLLFYKADNAKDDVLLETEARPNIVDALHNTSFLAGLNENTYLTKHEIMERVFKTHALTDSHLTSDDPQCAISITLSDFENGKASPSGTTNVYAYEQKVNIDIYAHEEYQIADMRLTRLLETLLKLLNPRQPIIMGAARFAGSSKLDGIANYEGVRSTFIIRWGL